MKTLNLSLLLIALFFFSSLAVIDAKAQTAFGGRLFTVNDNGDSNDVSVGDGICLDSNGKCTLRAAIQESNGSTGFNAINFTLPPASVIDLTLGELLITKVVHIVGPGARNLTIQRNSIIATPPFRIFHIGANAGFNMIIRGFKVRNGNTDGDGGAFYIEQGNSIGMTEVAVSNNSANRGGGIANAGALNLTRSLFNSNNATILNGAGGAVMNIDGGSTAIISDSTLTENSAVNGGAIYNQGNLLLVNNTISQNAASNFGSSIVSAAGGTINVLNTIIGIDSSSTISSLWGAFNSLGNNIISDARNSTGFTNGVNGDQVSTDNSINPMLGGLTDNGGQTDTMALQTESPAIDHGNSCVKTATCSAPVPGGFRLNSDQRTGFNRFSQIAVDVGAYESAASVTSANGSLGAYSSAGTRLANSLGVLTKASDGEKIYSLANPFSYVNFNNIKLDEVYIFERISKRAGYSYAIVFEFDDLAMPFNSNFASEEIKITF